MKLLPMIWRSLHKHERLYSLAKWCFHIGLFSTDWIGLSLPTRRPKCSCSSHLGLGRKGVFRVSMAKMLS